MMRIQQRLKILELKMISASFKHFSWAALKLSKKSKPSKSMKTMKLLKYKLNLQYVRTI